jgi:outer membrane protein assembly factor BamB
LDRATGEVRWQFNTQRSVEGSALVVGPRVYIGDSAGNLMVIAVDTGELVQKLELSGGIPGSPCLVGDRLLVATQEGSVYCLGRPAPKSE